MYESPVKISYDDINAKMVQAADGQILAIVQQLVSVDKDELLRALQYDRGQYEKGYEDGKRDAVKHGYWIGEFSKKRLSLDADVGAREKGERRWTN